MELLSAARHRSWSPMPVWAWSSSESVFAEVGTKIHLTQMSVDKVIKERIPQETGTAAVEFPGKYSYSRFRERTARVV